MITFRIAPYEGQIFEVDRVINQITNTFIESQVTAEDSFEAERIRTIQSINEITGKGKLFHHVETILASIDDKKSALGPGKDMLIPIGKKETLIGHVWARDIVFRSHKYLSKSKINSIKEFFDSLQIGDVKVYEVE